MRVFKTIPKLTSKQLKLFWTRVDKRSSNDCWIWTGLQYSTGYGRLSLRRKDYLATRVMLSIHGLNNTHLIVCHSCNNPSCVNPKHLRFDTVKSNAQDSMKAGTFIYGSRNGYSKLNEKDILKIFKLRKTQTYTAISKLFNVTKSTIQKIVTNNSWRHVSKPRLKEAYKPNVGINNPNARLTVNDVKLIRKLLHTMSNTQVAKLFKLNPATPDQIKHRRTWKHVKGVATDKEVAKFLKGRNLKQRNLKQRNLKQRNLKQRNLK